MHVADAKVEEVTNGLKAVLTACQEKAPKAVVPIDTIGRAPNGKVDYKRLKQYAADELGVPLP